MVKLEGSLSCHRSLSAFGIAAYFYLLLLTYFTARRTYLCLGDLPTYPLPSFSPVMERSGYRQIM